MSPEEKAKELVLRFAFKGAQHEGEAKTFALIAVDEILSFIEDDRTGFNWKDYWQEVKYEIKML
jgi:hypothetical protein